MRFIMLLVMALFTSTLQASEAVYTEGELFQCGIISHKDKIGSTIGKVSLCRIPHGQCLIEFAPPNPGRGKGMSIWKSVKTWNSDNSIGDSNENNLIQQNIDLIDEFVEFTEVESKSLMEEYYSYGPVFRHYFKCGLEKIEVKMAFFTDANYWYNNGGKDYIFSLEAWPDVLISEDEL